MPACTFPLLCSSCSSASVAKDFASHKSPAEAAAHQDTNRTDVTPPTGVDYAGQAAREFLDILYNVAQDVPVPAFGAAVKVAINIIKACDDSQATLESAQELKSRIQALLVVFVNELKGKRKEDIRPELIHDIDILNEDMKCIVAKLDKILSQRRFLLVFFRSLNDNKVGECIARLNNSMEKFTLKRSIDHTNMLTQLEQQIRTFYTQQKEDLIEFLRLGMDNVKSILNNRLPAATSPSSRSPIPANSTISHGRDCLVDDLVNLITGVSRQHICLSGPGGMGKTSTSLAVMDHTKVKAHFTNHLRVWVPCVKATSVSLFLDTLHTSLAIPKKTGDIRGDILSELSTSPPIIILLDNFETPWNVPGAQSEVERILRDMHQISHVSLFVTMRSSSPPCGDIPWFHIDLRAVNTAASHKIYTSWHPVGGEDLGLPRLLELTGNMPLAVTLMAKIAKVTHLSAAELVEEYNRRGTPMLGQGLDAENSMDVCIGLSVYSSHMKAHPEAFDLLCTISMLPTGTSYKMLSRWWASKLRNLAGALDVLKSTSLVEERDSTYFVLPVIQRYILDPSRFNDEVRASMIESACTFLKQHESTIGDPLYKEHTAALSEEEGNLEAVLLRATAPDPHIIQDGLLLLVRYQQYNRPRIDTVEHALKLAQAIDDRILRGDILICYSVISHSLFQYNKALQQAEEALDLFLSVPDRKKAAMSRLAIEDALGYCHDKQFELHQRIIEEAQADFESVGDEGGIGQCFLALGVLHRVWGDYSTALTLLKQAECILAKVEDRLHHAECTIRLAWAYYRSGQYDLAYSSATSSLEESKVIGDLTKCWDAGETTAIIMFARGEYKDSLELFFYCLTVCKLLGLAPRGQVLEGMGLAWAKLGKTTDARKAFEESKQRYLSEELSNIKSRNGVIRTKFFLQSLENPQLKPGTEELFAMRVWYTQDHIDRILSPL